MLLDFNKTIGYRCGECGRSLVKAINVFSLSNQQALSLSCECSGHCVTIKAIKDKYMIQVNCSTCSENHTFKLGHGAFWGKPLTTLYCTSTALPTLFIGDAEKVTEQIEAADKELEDLIDEMDDADIIPTFDEMIMMQAIDKIHEISDAGHLTCQCGSDDISFSLEPGCVCLVCENCGATETVLADSQKDLDAVLLQDSILLKLPQPKRSVRPRKTTLNLPE